MHMTMMCCQWWTLVFNLPEPRPKVEFIFGDMNDCLYEMEEI